MQTFDVAIIGGGIAGLSLAYFLGLHRSTVVLERETALGYHSTGRSAAEFVLRYNSPGICRLAAIAKVFFDSPPDGFAEIPLLKQRGGIMIATPEKADRLEALFNTERVFTPDLEILDVDGLHERLPILKPGYAATGFHDPNFWDIEVESLLQGYLRGARRNGVEIRAGHAVLSARHNGSAWTIDTPSGTVRTRTVVNAAGGWADQTAALFGIKPLDIVPHRRTAILIDPPEGIDLSAMPEINELDEDFYMKPDAGRLLACPADATPCEPGDVQPEELDIAWAAHYVEEATTIPVRRIAKSWAGMRSFAPDNLPVIGHSHENAEFFWLAGQGGFGILTSPALGRLAANLLTGAPEPEDFKAQSLDPQTFSPLRFSH
jgi:D-arginine dehydrogenase